MLQGRFVFAFTAACIVATGCSDHYSSTELKRNAGASVGGPALLVNLDGPVSVALGDFDGDAALDIAVANARGRSVTLFFGDGTGAFPRRRDVAIAAPEVPVAVGAGKFTGRAFDDVVVMGLPDAQTAGGQTADAAIDLIPADGSAVKRTNVFSNANAPFVAVGDLNHDGHLDILRGSQSLPDVFTRTVPAEARDAGRGVLEYLGRGDGTFAEGFLEFSGAPTGFVVFEGAPGQFVAAGSENGIPLFTADVNHGQHALLQAFDPQATVSALAVGAAFGSTQGHVGVAFADGDDGAGLHVAFWTPPRGMPPASVELLAPPTRASTSDAPRVGVTSVGVGDFDGDGHDDVAAVTWEGAAHLFLNDGKAHFTDTSIALPDGARPAHVAVGDLDGDGADDLAIAAFGESSVRLIFGRAKPD